MAQCKALELDKDVMSLLKDEGNGWKPELFENQEAAKVALCEHCNAVCCNAVELGCDHDDDADICLYCNECLQRIIDENGGQCPIDSHDDPVIISNRSMRRQILKYDAVCPHSLSPKKGNKQRKSVHDALWIQRATTTRKRA